MTLRKPLYSYLDHTADMGMWVHSGTLKELFEDAAAALLDIMLEGPPGRGENFVHISLKANDLTDLMIRWLGEILYLFDGEGLAVSDVNVSEISETSLEADVKAALLRGPGAQIRHEIKAVTYHGAVVSKDKDGWHTRVIFDL